MTRTADYPTQVLCVDDRWDVLAAIRWIIESDPSMKCVGCLSSADNLIDEVQSRDPQPDVVVLDATMPGRNPMEALQELSSRCPSVRTIIYSGHDDPESVSRARNAGAWGWVTKDADSKELLRAVREAAASQSRATRGKLIHEALDVVDVQNGRRRA